MSKKCSLNERKIKIFTKIDQNITHWALVPNFLHYLNPILGRMRFLQTSNLKPHLYWLTKASICPPSQVHDFKIFGIFLLKYKSEFFPSISEKIEDITGLEIRNIAWILRLIFYNFCFQSFCLKSLKWKKSVVMETILSKLCEQHYLEMFILCMRTFHAIRLVCHINKFVK